MGFVFVSGKDIIAIITAIHHMMVSTWICNAYSFHGFILSKHPQNCTFAHTAPSFTNIETFARTDPIFIFFLKEVVPPIYYCCRNTQRKFWGQAKLTTSTPPVSDFLACPDFLVPIFVLCSPCLNCQNYLFNLFSKVLAVSIVSPIPPGGSWPCLLPYRWRLLEPTDPRHILLNGWLLYHTGPPRHSTPLPPAPGITSY